MTVKGVQIQIASGMSYTVQEKPTRNTCGKNYGIKVIEPILETLYGMEEKIMEEEWYIWGYLNNKENKRTQKSLILEQMKKGKCNLIIICL